MGMYSETAGLDPVVSNGGGTTGQTELTAIYDTLMRYNPEKKVFEPQLAESLTANADSTEWTLKLRANTKFTDNTDLNAEAVVEVEIETEIPGMLSVDGRLEGELLHGDVVRIERSALRARFLRLRRRNDFYETLVQRLTPRNGGPYDGTD